MNDKLLVRMIYMQHEISVRHFVVKTHDGPIALSDRQALRRLREEVLTRLQKH
jgi:hypothetical protein